jgi:hypothetical protein
MSNALVVIASVGVALAAAMLQYANVLQRTPLSIPT